MADLEKLNAAKLAPVYVLVAQDPLLLERAVTRVRDVALPESARAFNYDVIDGKGATAAQVIGMARTLPMMAERRLVLVRGAGGMAAGELGALVSYLEDPCTTTVLVVTCEKADRRLKFYGLASRRKLMIELSPPRNLTAWVDREAAQRGIAIGRDATSHLVDVVGRDPARLALCIDQLALFAGDRPVARSDVDELVAGTRERTVFELTDAIGDGDLPRALIAVAALFEQRESPIGMIVMLARHMRQLGIARDGMARRMPKGDLGKELGVPPFVVDKLLGQARKLAPRAISSALVTLSEADVALKGGQPRSRTLGRDLGDSVVVEKLVADLVALGSANRSSRR